MSTVSRLQLWNACLGNLFEHYDTALFGFLAPFLAPLIFPAQEPITALILTYAIIPLGMIARPLGSLVFGHIGDTYGRKYALFLTLGGMSFVSGCIALSPTYLQAGILAPIIFCIGRVLQNFLAAGETMGGAIFLLENSSEKRHDLLSSLYSASTMGGHLLASLGVFLLSHFHAVDPGWRFLYLCGCITGVFGCLFRRSVPTIQSSEGIAKLRFGSKSALSTPDSDFSQVAYDQEDMSTCEKREPASKSSNLASEASFAIPSSVRFSETVANLRGVFWKYRKPLLSIMLTSGFASANYSMALVLMNGFIPLISSLTKAEVMKINTYLLIFDFCALPFFGWIASKIPREKLMLAASSGVVVFAVPLLISLEGASLVGVIGVRIALVIFGVAFFAPFHAWAGQLIPPACRYAVISLGYALGTQLLGSPTAALALWSFKKTGLVASVSWYWMVLASASSLVILMALRAKRSRQLIS